MENASKALIIAGAILLAILLISLGMLLKGKFILKLLKFKFNVFIFNNTFITSYIIKCFS